MTDLIVRDMPYTAAAEKQLKSLFCLLGIRVIPAYFYEANRVLFERWHYNACNQTALITAYVLARLLESPGRNKSNPFYQLPFDIEIFEGVFTEPNTADPYNHAYVFAKEVAAIEDAEGHTLAEDQGDRMSFFIDVARVTNPTVFQMGYNLSGNPESYSNNYKMQSTTKLDVEAMLQTQPEYYTGKLGIEICYDITIILHKLGFDLTQFNWKA